MSLPANFNTLPRSTSFAAATAELESGAESKDEFQRSRSASTTLEQYEMNVGSSSNSVSSNTVRRTHAYRNNDHAGDGSRANETDKVQSGRWTLENIKLAACYWSLMAAGWNDASLGALIPYLEQYFSIGYLVVSVLFISSAVGYFIAGALNNRLTDRFGMGAIITGGAFLQCLGYIAFIPPAPFPTLPVMNVIVGFGVAYQDAQANAWVAGLPKAHIKLGYLHGAYGFGGLISPLIATAFVQSGTKFSYFFAVSLAMATINTLVLFFSFVWKQPHVRQTPHSHRENSSSAAQPGQPSATTEQHEVSRAVRRRDSEEDGVVHPDELATASAAGAPALSASLPEIFHSTKEKDKLIFSNKTVWFCAFFLLLYVGCEVTIGGWIVSYLLEERDGPVSAGYVSSGFWGGIMVGRLVLPRFNVWFGERNVVFLYLGLAIALEFVIWFVKNLISNAVAVSLIGVLLGPLYPSAISVSTKLLPKYLHTGAVGFMASVGSGGAAVFPFLTGILAQKYSTKVLQPVIIALLVGQAVLWLFVPSPPRRDD